jgi:hypothetical protein
MWAVATTDVEVRLRIQLNTTLFAKTLVKKDIASSAPSSTSKDSADQKERPNDESDRFSSKAQVMTLMTTDVDRVSDFAWHLFYLVNSPIKIAIGMAMLYNLLGTLPALCFSELMILPFNRRLLLLWSGCHLAVPAVESFCRKDFCGRGRGTHEGP